MHSSGFDLEEVGHDLAGFAFDDVSEGGGIERGLWTDVDGTGSVLTRPVDEICCGVDGAGGANDDHAGAPADLSLDAVHFERDFSEEDDVRAKAAFARAARDLVEGAVDCGIWDGRTAAVKLAT